MPGTILNHFLVHRNWVVFVIPPESSRKGRQSSAASCLNRWKPKRGKQGCYVLVESLKGLAAISSSYAVGLAASLESTPCQNPTFALILFRCNCSLAEVIETFLKGVNS